MKRDIDVDSAQKLILENVCQLPAERCHIMQAFGRILAESVLAERDLPPESKSAVDGFALGDESAQMNCRFHLTGFVRAGEYPGTAVHSGEAMGVVTGGCLPSGTRSVIMHEKTAVEANSITVLEEVKPYQNIKQAGEDYHQGEVLLPPGTFLHSGHIALLAAFGHSDILVYRRPKVAILSLGKNIMKCSQKLEPGQIWDSNSPMLAALLHQAGCELTSIDLESRKDSQELPVYLDAAACSADSVILTGGTYAGSQSEARQLLDSVQARMIYWGTDSQPGSHNGFALIGSVPVFALSGNPAACAVGFTLFVLPAVRHMQGINPDPKKVRARCTNSFNKGANSRRYIRGRARCSDQGWTVTVLPGQKPSMIRSLISCNALIEVAPGSPPLEAGASVNIILLEEAD